MTNTSRETPNPGLLTQFVYAVHDDAARVFRPATVASAGLEVLAEDCLTGPLLEELTGAAGFAEVGLTTTPDGASDTGPLRPGESYTFTVTADARHRWLNLVSMPFPTNDALVAFAPGGVALLDEAGRPRPDSAIAMDVTRTLRAWDAGTEANQCGAAGGDQSPHQPSLDSGAAEGDGTVRATADPVWSYPAVDELVRVTVRPR